MTALWHLLTDAGTRMEQDEQLYGLASVLVPSVLVIAILWLTIWRPRGDADDKEQ